jgi:hypothetical protein
MKKNSYVELVHHISRVHKVEVISMMLVLGRTKMKKGRRM